MISLNDISLSYGSKVIIRGFSGDLKAGELIALCGSNGAGKSTLLRAVLGIHPLKEGTIAIANKPAASYSAKERAMIMAPVFTRNQSVPVMKVHDLIEVGRKNESNGYFDPSSIGIDHLLELWCNELSDGQYQRVMLARALNMNTDFLIFDEPLSHLDHGSKKELINTFAMLKEQGKGILFSTHDILYLNEKIDEIWNLDEYQST